MFNWNQLRETGKEMLGKARERLTPMFDATKTKTDRAAENLAGKMSQWAGKEVTPRDVKKIAVVSAAVIIGLSILQGVGSMETGPVGGSGANTGSGSDAGFDNSFEGQSAEFFANKGGLNIETRTVDADGVMLD